MEKNKIETKFGIKQTTIFNTDNNDWVIGMAYRLCKGTNYNNYSNGDNVLKISPTDGILSNVTSNNLTFAVYEPTAWETMGSIIVSIDDYMNDVINIHKLMDMEKRGENKNE